MRCIGKTNISTLCSAHHPITSCLLFLINFFANANHCLASLAISSIKRSLLESLSLVSCDSAFSEAGMVPRGW